MGGRSRAKGHTAGQFTSALPHFGPTPTPGVSSCVPPPLIHTSLSLPSPHFPPLPPGSKIKATRDAATVLSLLGRTEPLTAETGRTREQMGWPRLGPGSLGSGPGLVQHLLIQSQGTSTSVTLPEPLLRPALVLLENIPLCDFSSHAEARKVNSSMFRTDLIHLASNSWVAAVPVRMYMPHFAQDCRARPGELWRMRLEREGKGRF